MANREFDIIVFGATGVTGRYVCEQTYLYAKQEGFKWAVAGRNESRLIEALKEVAGWLEVQDVEKFVKEVPKVIADTGDQASLVNMAKRSRIILSTVGPFRFYGEPVVKACVEAATDLIDVSGEPSYIESMQWKYHKQCQEKGIYIVSACGFDSLPCELLMTFTKENFRGRLNSFESYLKFNTSASSGGFKVNIGTWNSAVHGVSNWGALKKIRTGVTKELFTKKMPKAEVALKSRGAWFANPIFDGYCIPFLGSDRSVVIKSEMFRNETTEDYKPVQVRCYFSLPNLFAVFTMFFLGFVFFLFSQFSFTRKLLLDYPGFFSLGLFGKDGPTRTQVLGSRLKMSGLGKGWANGENTSDAPTHEIQTSIEGPDPGYLGTSILMTTSAVCILKERLALPRGGGCISPGFAFEKTTILKRLQDKGFKFSVVKQS